MMMSVYRARQAVSQLDHATCLAGAVTAQDLDLVGLCMSTQKPVLIGLDHSSTIIKPLAEGDEHLTFESLYDTCYTLADLQKMRRAGVSSPDKVPPEAYRLDVVIETAGSVQLSIALLAGSTGETKAALRDLFLRDVMFREALMEAVATALLRQVVTSDELVFAIRDCTAATYEPLEPPLTADGPTWRFLDPAI